MLKRETIKSLLFIINLIVILSSHIYSQKQITKDFVLQNWKMQQGLSLNSVNDVKSDKNNFIWISTLLGVTKFDGENFTLFNNSNCKNIKNIFVHNLFYDNKGSLYFSTYGEGIFKIENNKIKTIKKDDFKLKLHLKCPVFIAEKKILYIKKNQLYLFADNKEILLRKNINKPKKIIQYKDKIFIFCQNILFIFNKDITKAQEPIKIKLKEYIHDIKIQNNKYFMIVGKDRELQEISLNNQGYEIRQKYKIKNIDDVLLKKNNKEIVIISNSILYIIDYKGTIKDKEKLPFYISISSIHEDKFSNIWIGSEKNGLYKIHKGWVHNIIVFEKDRDREVYSLLADKKGGIWFSGKKNCIGYIKDSQAIKYYKTKMSNINTISQILEDEIILSGLNADYLEILNLRKKTNDTISIPQKNNDVKFIKKIEDKLFIGCQRGLLTLDKNRNLNSIMDKALLKYRISSIISKNKNQIFLATMDGHVLLLDLLKQKVEEITQINATINHLHYNQKEDLLFATCFQNGLYIIKDKEYININKDKGLKDNMLYSVTEDDKNRIWCSSTQGIFYLNKKDVKMFMNKRYKKVTPFNYGLEEGMSSISCTGGNITGSVIKTNDKKLWYPTKKAISIINLDKDIKLPEIKIFLENIYVNGEKRDLSCREFTTQERLAFSFSIPNYPLINKVRYRYMILGLENPQWVYTKKRMTSYYTNLPKGEYKFILQASLPNQRWSDPKISQKEIIFVVKADNLKEILKKSIIPFFIIVIGIIIYRIKIIYYKNYQKKLNKIIEEKTIELIEANIAITKADSQKRDLLYRLTHDFNNKLQIISGNAQLITSTKDNKKIKSKSQIIYEISKSLKSLNDDILRDFRNKSNDEHKTDLKEKINLSQLAKNNYKLFSIDAVKKSIKWKCQTEPECIIEGNPTRVREILENLISNAIKFTPIKGGEIQLKVYKTSNKCIFEISDNGMGFSEEDKKELYKKFSKIKNKPTNNEKTTGLGLYLTKKLIEMENAEIELESEQGKGSTFKVSFCQAEEE